MQYTFLVEFLDKSSRYIDVSIGRFVHESDIDCFHKLAPSQRLLVRTQSRQEHLSLALDYLNNLDLGLNGKLAYSKTRNYEMEEPHYNLSQNNAHILPKPYILESNDLIESVIMGGYNPKKHYVGMAVIGIRLFNPKSFHEMWDYLSNIGDDSDFNFAISLGTYDNSLLSKVEDIQKILETHRFANKKRFVYLNDPVVCSLDEYISLFSIDSNTGTMIIQKSVMGHEDLLNNLNQKQYK